MATAKKLPSGSWRCLVYSHTDEIQQPDGSIKKKRIYKSFTCDDPSKAGKRACERMAANWAASKEFEFAESKIQKMTLSEAINQYISQKTPILSPATIKGYETVKHGMREHAQWLMEKDIHQITQDDMQRLINGLSGIRTPKTIRNYHGLISAALKANNVPLTLNTNLPKRVQPDLYIPSDTDVRKLIRAVSGTELEIPILLAAFCTMRRGEIGGLSMSDINGNIIHVHHSLVIGADKKWYLKEPKTASSDRYIEAPEFVIEKIKKQGYITKLHPDRITHLFEKTLKKNDIPSFRFHDLRHYSASIQHALGIPDAYIMQRGGWGSDAVLKSVYRHAMNDRQKEMNQIANAHFESLCNTEMQHKRKTPD